MFAKKLLIAAAAVVTVSVATLGEIAPAQAGDPGAAWAAGAAGLVGGLILGGALAQPEPEPDPAYVVSRRPVRVIEEEEVVVRQRCWREVWYDNWGDRHVRRICR